MNKRIYIAPFFLLYCSLLFGQSTVLEQSIIYLSPFEAKHYEIKNDNSLNRLLMSDSHMNNDIAQEISETLTTHIQNLKKLQERKSPHAFLRSVFYRTHSKFLRRYEKFSIFSEIFHNKGAYDCVTGTALLAYIYNELGYKTTIKETTFHLYLVVNDNNKNYLIESTDPASGFTSDPSEILAKMRTYENDGESKSDGYQFKGSVNNRINIEHLVALQYYNQAIHRYNGGDYKQAYINILKASDLYDSKRVLEIRDLMTSDFVLAKN